MDRRTLERAAARHAYLRGLIVVPLGAVSVLAAAGNEEVGPLRHLWLFPVLAMALAGVAVLVARYYSERYGRVSLSGAQQVRAGLAVLLGVVVVVGGSELLRSHASFSLDLPVNATAATFALVMLISYGLGVGLATHHVIVWGSLLLAGAIPLWTGPDPSNVGLVLDGVAVMINGILDHRLFVSAFGTPQALGREELSA